MTVGRPKAQAPITGVRATAFEIPTDKPESDGTLQWRSTTLVLAEVSAAGERGIGYTYGHQAVATVIATTLADVLAGREALATAECWAGMVAALRNQGGSGVAAMAVAAVDAALWDLKGRLFGQPVVALLGAARPSIQVYGSGGFTSYSEGELSEQFGRWVSEGMALVKMKVGRKPARDARRMAVAHDALAGRARLMIDANGAYSRKCALHIAATAAELGVVWFEEPVSSEDLPGLSLLRDSVPAPMEIAAGEYGFDIGYFRRMLEAGAVDVLQVDGTRCRGITGVMQADALAQAFEIPLSAHCAPALHCHPACAARSMRHVEWFHDHVRIERMLFDGGPEQVDGAIAPDLTRPGLGFEFRRADAARYEIGVGHG